MKKSGGKGVCFQIQVDTITALLRVIPYPVIVTKPDGSFLIKNQLWRRDSDKVRKEQGLDEIPIYWCNEEHLLSVWVDTSSQMSDSDVTRWKESAQELKTGLASLVSGNRIPLPQPEQTDPLADVKKEFNAALETVERLISVSRLF